MANKKTTKKTSSSNNVVVGAVKTHKKRLWFGALAVLLILSIGTGSFVVWKGNSLKAKAENWTTVAYNLSGGYNLRACKIPGWGFYTVTVFGTRTLSSPNYSIIIGEHDSAGHGRGGGGSWSMGWGFYYFRYDILVPSGHFYDVSIGSVHYGGAPTSVRNC